MMLALSNFPTISKSLIDDLWDAGCKSEDALLMGRQLRMWRSRRGLLGQLISEYHRGSVDTATKANRGEPSYLHSS